MEKNWGDTPSATLKCYRDGVGWGHKIFLGRPDAWIKILNYYTHSCCFPYLMKIN